MEEARKKMLILQARPDEVADFEYDAFLKYGGLAEEEVHRIRMEEAGIPSLDLAHYYAVVVGGGPFNTSDSEEKKSPEQKRLETDLTRLLHAIVERDFPYLGACYGFSALGRMCGGTVSKEAYGEGVGAVEIRLTEAGAADPLLEGIPSSFYAFAGHKEACQTMPEDAVLLASSAACPVHMFRMKQNVYATQFHPELDVPGLHKRIDVYKHHGYFPPEDADSLKAEAEKHAITVPMEILHRFVERYRAL